jgi:RNA polymerase sigma-70 factor, ECF subfamily
MHTCTSPSRTLIGVFRTVAVPQRPRPFSTSVAWTGVGATGESRSLDADARPESAPRLNSMSPGDLFTAEVQPHLHLLHRTALRLTHDEQAAEDLLQDTLERAFVHFRRYETGTNIRAWLLRIMNNVRISGYRRDARRPQAGSLDGVEEFSLYRAVRNERIAPADVETVVLNRIGEEAILRAIDGLSEDFRMVTLLADVEGFSYKEMAAILQVPIGTVTSRLFRARKYLQRALWEQAVAAGVLREDREVPTA